jgi:hypothetical protein
MFHRIFVFATTLNVQFIRSISDAFLQGAIKHLVENGGVWSSNSVSFGHGYLSRVAFRDDGPCFVVPRSGLQSVDVEKMAG